MNIPAKVTFGLASDADGAPLSQAVINYGPQLYVSGQLGRNPATGQPVTDSAEAQFRQAFRNFKAVVESAGATLGDVLKLNIYLTDMEHYPMVNAVMRQYFWQPFPARSAIGVASLNGALIEIDGIQWSTTATITTTMVMTVVTATTKSTKSTRRGRRGELECRMPASGDPVISSHT